MKKINFKGIKEILSERELKNVLGGSGSGSANTCFKCYNGDTGSCCSVSGDCRDHMDDMCPAGYMAWDCWCY